jgi:hypothetical protein
VGALGRARDLNAEAGKLARLAPDARSKLRMRAALLSIPVRKRVPALSRRPLKVTITVGTSRRTVHLSERADFTTMDDVFGEGEY